MIDLLQLRREPDVVKSSLGRRGVPAELIDQLAALDVEHRRLLQRAESLRARIKELSRDVGEARREKNNERAEQLTVQSRALGDDERSAHDEAERAGAEVNDLLLALPNLPAPDVPDGLDESGNVELRRWWPGLDEGVGFPTYEEYQRVAHWEIGDQLGLLDLDAGAKLAGSMFPLYRGDGARLVRALGAFSLDANTDEYEEIRPPSFALTETMTSTGHLPKSADDMYAIERDGLWAIPTAEVPLTSMRRGDILDEATLPVKMKAFTPCFRREAGAAGRDTRGLLRVHEFDKVELFAYCTPEQAPVVFDDVLARAEAILRALQIPYRVLALCAGDLGTSSARTYDLEAYAPGVDQWLEVSSVSWFRDFQSRRANVRYRPSGGATALVHTVNGSALGFARVWAALVETYRQRDGSIEIPLVLRPYFAGRTKIERRQ